MVPAITPEPEPLLTDPTAALEPTEALEPDAEPITPPPEIDGCVWEERCGSHHVRCCEPTLPNRPFCTEHERRFRHGRSLTGRGLLSPVARN
jgi:hypothetical protein